MFRLDECNVRDVPDGLFLERLEAFMEKSLADIRAFAAREDRPFDEIRRSVAEWHSKSLFKRGQSVSSTAAADDDRSNQQPRVSDARSVLCDASGLLESLWEVSGVHSFLLAVDPDGDPGDSGFLGGTVLGREFWRGLRGGGELGAKNFRLYCLRDRPAAAAAAADDVFAGDAQLTKRPPANALKTEIYANIRSALRAASGVRNAEMKWTNHDRLSTYGVRIVGWPRDVPLQNPSTLTSSQNKVLLECLKNGSLHFARIAEQQHLAGDPTDGDELSWMYEDVVATDS